MFLNGKQILERLHRGELVVDPSPDHYQVREFTLLLRLGTEFRELWAGPLEEGEVLDISTAAMFRHPEKSPMISVEWGGRVVLQPHSGLLATTLEYIQIPPDLAALIFPRSAWERVGLVIVPSAVHPGFEGKLALSLYNLGNVPIAMRAGLPIVNLVFSLIEAPEAGIDWEKYRVAVGPELTKVDVDTDFEKLRSLMSERARLLQTRPVLTTSIRDLLTQALKADGYEKGKLLEKLAVEILSTIEGLKVLRVNARLKAEELDILLQNDIGIGFWGIARSPIIVECKNWSKKVGAREISVLFDKLASIGPDAKVGILIAPNGISGDSYSDAVLKIREKRQQGRYIIVLDRQALEEIADGTHAAVVIEKKYHELLFI